MIHAGMGQTEKPWLLSRALKMKTSKLNSTVSRIINILKFRYSLQESYKRVSKNLPNFSCRENIDVVLNLWNLRPVSPHSAPTMVAPLSPLLQKRIYIENHFTPFSLPLTAMSLEDEVGSTSSSKPCRPRSCLTVICCAPEFCVAVDIAPRPPKSSPPLSLSLFYSF